MKQKQIILQRNTKTARRRFLQLCGGLMTLAFLQPAFARKKAPSTAFGTLDEAIAAELGAAAKIRFDERLVLTVPDIAEDGAIVPISVEGTLSGVKSLLIFVEKNPTPLTARFNFQVDMQSFVSLHIKMNESSDVVIVAETADGFHSTRKWVKVLQGGCA
ncbi:thiosulfate oxidation carrier protein SoxY [Candidatus Methylospira mobilis]|uniref:Thiosulfate oxidation carrier protein SoxY n=1 Tax=Candidatus Methylospira mobilis TaxID=1808979 RepID=A0A5Q0BJ12_9GAMM|nr:thiosulfate oxidation carrier protein SoxY [Candidatus Methylospira mobilis]QFY43112.1 thiosulfate oxidation carrier protein SoxY [Candidatus Methylospira mobilis]WNV03742.1 thiosulfate oxidation carrier protein SoxY [Candidatus Methylospira mobilis]